MPGIMNESEFHRAVDAVLARIETSLEDADDLDVDLESGILTVTCPDGEPRDREPADAQPRDLGRGALRRLPLRACATASGATRARGDELFASLARIIESQAGVKTTWK